MGTKQIPLTRGMFALVDESDYEWLSQWKWFAHEERNTFYALRNQSIKGGGQRGLIAMHRQILGLTDRSQRGDHRDGNGLNNTRKNLRPCSNVQNLWNQGPRPNSISGTRGVSFHIKANKWRARIKIAGRDKHLGLFTTQDEAIAAYTAAAIRLRGEFAGIDKMSSVTPMAG